MDTTKRTRLSQRCNRVSVNKEVITDSLLHSVKLFLQSRKELCNITVGEYQETSDAEYLAEATFVGFTEGPDTTKAQGLVAVSAELLELLDSLQVYTVKDNEVIFLRTIKSVTESMEQTSLPGLVCVMRLSPTFPNIRDGSLFNLLSKYTAAVHYSVDTYSVQECDGDRCHTEEDDTNQSVSSIEDDFVTALEHLEEESLLVPGVDCCTPKKQRDVASQTFPSHTLDTFQSQISLRLKSPGRSVSSVNTPGLQQPLSHIKNSVTTSISGPGRLRTFYWPRDTTVQKVNKTLKPVLSTSPAESTESECSSPSPVIFLDEEGYQKSLKAKLEIPTIPVFKDGIEDSDSELSEFFDSFDQFDDLDQTLESTCTLVKESSAGSQLQKRKFAQVSLTSSTSAAMNPHKFEHSVLPANVRKPTPRKPESPYSSVSDVPDSPRLVKTAGEDSGALFSPIRSSAFSPMNSCTAECPCKLVTGTDRTRTQGVHFETGSSCEKHASIDVLGSVFNFQTPTDEKIGESISYIYPLNSTEGKQTVKQFCSFSPTAKEIVAKKSRERSPVIKDGIQRFAADLVEKSFGGAFRDLQKGVSSCTNALCHLAARLTSSVFQMAFHEIEIKQAFLLKKRAISGLANFLVSDAMASALKELQFVKKQIFNNTVTRFAAELAEELVFEGVMEVCQFSHPPTPAATNDWLFDYQANVVGLYAKDLSESVIQEAFIHLSQVDVTFTTQAAISVSSDNIKYVGTGITTQGTQNASTQEGILNTVISKPLLIKDYSMPKALLYVSGIASSILVPAAGKALSQSQALCELIWRNPVTCESEGAGPKMCRDYGYKTYSANMKGDIANIKPVDLPPAEHRFADSKPSFCSLSLFNSENKCNITSEVTNGHTSMQNFCGAMVDMIVNEAYELMTSSKVRKAVSEYADCLSENIVDKTPVHMVPPNKLSPKNHHASEEAVTTAKFPLDKVKPLDFSTLENEGKISECSLKVGRTRCELHCSRNKQGLEFKKVGVEQSAIDACSHQLYCKFSDEQNTAFFSCEPSESKKEFLCNCLPVHPHSMAGRSYVNIDEGVSWRSEPFNMGKPMNRSLQNDQIGLVSQDSSKHAFEVIIVGQGINRSDGSTSLSEFISPELEVPALPFEYGEIGSKITSVPPGTPPPTPMQPQQINPNKKLKSLTKKLKGELAKEFLPATPPPTPRNPSVTCLSEVAQNSTEKEDFLVKLMRSLSEEVDSSEEEETNEALGRETKYNPKTLWYADHLASHVTSVATEMAAFWLDDRRLEGECDKSSPFLTMLNANNGYTALVGKLSEHSLKSLWSYASNITSGVLSDVKKVISSNHKKMKIRRMNNWHTSYCDLGRDCKDNKVRDRLSGMAEQWSRDVLRNALLLPHSSNMSGLMSKYPSCESVTDEYAEHIIKVLKKEGGNSDLIMEQYASRLAYKSVKSGLQQAARRIKQRYQRRLLSSCKTQVDGAHELFPFLSKEQNEDKYLRNSSNTEDCSSQVSHKEVVHSDEYMETINFAECLAHSIACDVKRKLKMPSLRLPKSLTDSCLYKRSKLEEMTEDIVKTAFSTSVPHFGQKNKLYHSTGNLTDNGCSEAIVQVIEEFAKQIVDDTLEMSFECVRLQTVDQKKVGLLTDTERLLDPTLQPSSLARRFGNCRVKDHLVSAKISHPCLGAHELSQIHQVEKQATTPMTESCCYKARAKSLDIPKIHIDADQRAAFAEELVTVAIEKAKRDLSNTSLAGDSGIGQDGISFAECITVDIMKSAMTNASKTVNISGVCKDGFRSGESAFSQQQSLSVGDDSTGSWSNLSFEDEHPDESSSFLHLSDSNGNSSSWSSLGLEGEVYEENVSFPPSDSDGAEEKEEPPKDDVEALAQGNRVFLNIINIDVEPYDVDIQVRIALQWVAASQFELSGLHFNQAFDKELSLFSMAVKQLRERDWKVGDLLQAVLKYCRLVEHASSGRKCLHKSLFEWLLEDA
ncbi:A-kinase anchor protein 11 isoform X2 [Protopterus annectens]|uniref:A-kinase anchor protein 11 isoform X2 n=1 Tax=Protopterus annectens TaxID=7888 RepID=UPI001CFA23EE|nr:A-kinase anchor protein 11 isoform X2 [Protopterus annectens]